MSIKKLLILDGHNIVRRVYEANPVEDSAEKVESALSASTGSLVRALKEHQPSHVLLTFDAGGESWRHRIYPDYKKDRKPTPAFLAAAFPEFKQRLANKGWPVVEFLGQEADDTIASGTISALKTEGAEVVILSTDKDMVYLVSKGAHVYDHFKGEWRDTPWCEAKFGVKPALMMDFLALMGDAADGIPGVSGVGAKTAAKLLLEHGSLHAVLTAAENAQIKGKVGEKLVAQREQAEISRALSDLDTSLFEGELNWSRLATDLIRF